MRSTPTPPSTRTASTLPPSRADQLHGLRRRSTGGHSANSAPIPDGPRLTLAREVRGLTRTELAVRVRVDEPLISKLEANLVPFRAWMLQRMAAELDFPEAFFLPRPGRDRDLLDQADFRRHQTRAHVLELTRAHRWTELLAETADQLPLTRASSAVTLQPMPGTAPEDAAHAVRDLFGVAATAPIPHLIDAVEQAGGQIIGIPLAIENRGTFSTWHAERPMITVLAGQAGDRLRFGVAHELAHLLLHDTHCRSKDSEDEANRFAAELLVPAGVVVDHLPARPTLDAVRTLNETWQAPLPLLLRRTREAGLVNTARHRRLLDQLDTPRRLGLQPAALAAEKPRGFRQLVETLYGIPVDLARIAHDLSWTPGLVWAVLEEYSTGPAVAAASRS